MASLMVKARQLVHEYIRRDEEGNPIAAQMALDHVDIDIKRGVLSRFWDIMVLVSRHWQSI